MDEIDSLDPDDKHYIKRKADLDDRLYKMYDKIEDTENQLVAARAKKMAIEAEKLTGDNIYKVLIYFDKLYSVMDDQEKRQLMESLLSQIQARQSPGPIPPHFFFDSFHLSPMYAAWAGQPAAGTLDQFRFS
jgi:site-specific DNA recombinase